MAEVRRLLERDAGGAQRVLEADPVGVRAAAGEVGAGREQHRPGGGPLAAVANDVAHERADRVALVAAPLLDGEFEHRAAAQDRAQLGGVGRAPLRTGGAPEVREHQVVALALGFARRELARRARRGLLAGAAQDGGEFDRDRGAGRGADRDREGRARVGLALRTQELAADLGELARGALGGRERPLRLDQELLASLRDDLDVVDGLVGLAPDLGGGRVARHAEDAPLAGEDQRRVVGGDAMLEANAARPCGAAGAPRPTASIRRLRRRSLARPPRLEEEEGRLSSRRGGTAEADAPAACPGGLPRELARRSGIVRERPGRRPGGWWPRLAPRAAAVHRPEKRTLGFCGHSLGVSDGT
jgi:hypothetical protein